MGWNERGVKWRRVRVKKGLGSGMKGNEGNKKRV
jgi:hypothetical protein